MTRDSLVIALGPGEDSSDGGGRRELGEWQKQPECVRWRPAVQTFGVVIQLGQENQPELRSSEASICRPSHKAGRGSESVVW